MWIFIYTYTTYDIDTANDMISFSKGIIDHAMNECDFFSQQVI